MRKVLDALTAENLHVYQVWRWLRSQGELLYHLSDAQPGHVAIAQ